MWEGGKERVNGWEGGKEKLKQQNFGMKRGFERGQNPIICRDF